MAPAWAPCCCHTSTSRPPALLETSTALVPEGWTPAISRCTASSAQPPAARLAVSASLSGKPIASRVELQWKSLCLRQGGCSGRFRHRKVRMQANRLYCLRRLRCWRQPQVLYQALPGPRASSRGSLSHERQALGPQGCALQPPWPPYSAQAASQTATPKASSTRRTICWQVGQCRDTSSKHAPPLVCGGTAPGPPPCTHPAHLLASCCLSFSSFLILACSARYSSSLSPTSSCKWGPIRPSQGYYKWPCCQHPEQQDPERTAQLLGVGPAFRS